MSSETNTETNDNTENTEPFYSLSEEYWSKQPPTVNGMLGGFDYISQIDVEQSQLFLDHFISVIDLLYFIKRRLERHSYNEILIS